LYDFGSFVASGQAAAAGLNPYSGDYPLVFRPYNEEIGATLVSPNLNPPVSLLLFELLAQSNPITAFRIWYVVSLLLYVAVIVTLARAYPRYATPLRVAWALSLAGFWHTLELGQIYVPLLLAATLAIIAFQKGRPLLAGVLIGLIVAIKPNFAVWPALLLLASHWAAAGAAIGMVGILSLLPLLRYPPTIYLQWAEASGAFAGRSLMINTSLPGLGDRVGLPWLGLVLAGALLLALAWWAWRYRPSVLAVSGLALLTSLLASPIAWVGYTVLLLPVLFQRRWTWPEWVAAAMLVVPYTTAYFFAWLPPILTELGWYVWALLLLLAVLAREARKRSMTYEV
jgi:hypothetical protein